MSVRTHATPIISAIVATLALHIALAAPASAQTPVEPANGQKVQQNDVVLRWTLEPGWSAQCVEWSSRPETSYPGGPFLAPDGSECYLSPQAVAYLLDDLAIRRYYWHVKVSHDCDESSDACDYQQTWGPTAYFDSVAPPPPPPPTGCSANAAQYVTSERLLPYAHSKLRSYFSGIDDDVWGIRRICRDLDRDGDSEMIVILSCCTGGSVSPWAIFKHDDTGQWRMRYARVNETVFRLGVRGRVVRAMMPAPYEGACTRFVRYREVRWHASRFHSRVTRRSRLHSVC